MKCPRCSKSHKKKDGLKCACGYRFIFVKSTGDAVSDAQFLRMNDLASGNGSYAFTTNQLLVAFARVTRKSPKTPLIVGGVMLSAALLLLWAGVPGLASLAGFICMISLVVAAVRASRRVRMEELSRVIDKWHASGRKIERLLIEPGLAREPRPWKEPDIYDYGVERVLVVERPVLVDLFVRNELHSEQRAAIIAENGYPLYLVPRVQQLLQESPQLPVFLLHDAIDSGSRTMADRLRADGRLPIEGHPMVDLGFFHDEFYRLPALRRFRGAEREGLNAADLVPYGALSAMVAAAMVEQVPLAAVIARRRAADDTLFGSFG